MRSRRGGGPGSAERAGGKLRGLSMAAIFDGASAASSLLNPWGLSLSLWVGAFVCFRLVLLVGIEGTVSLLGQLLPKLPTRTGDKAPYQHPLGRLDFTYLAINSCIEFTFTNQLIRLLWFSPIISRAPATLGVLNSAVALWLLLIVDDMLYAPAHRLMHWPPLYKHVHKHHHRNTFPARGYIDGANEHPLEQLIALSLHWIALYIVAYTTGLHVAAVAAHLLLKAAGACFNHTGYDLRLNFLGIDYSVRAHEMHHRHPQKNFAQYVMFWDRLMGTYEPYSGGSKGADAHAKLT